MTKPIFLCIETSAEICSVALHYNEGEIISLHSEEPRSHGTVLTTLIEEMMRKSGLQYKTLDFVAVSSGPGSYTGLRIGVSTAKGICFAHDLPLISVESFDSMYSVARNKDLINGKEVIAMIDARRMEVYSLKWNTSGERVDQPEAVILEETYLDTIAKENTVFIGNGASKLLELPGSDGLQIHSDIFPESTFMVDKALEKYASNEIENTAYFEPFYLKAFYITKAKNPLGNGK